MKRSTRSRRLIAIIEFNTIAQQLYDFVWSDYCDWFVEAAKTDIFGDGRNEKEIRAGGDGFCSCRRFCDCSIRSCRTSPKSFGRCFGFGKRIDPVRAAAEKIRLDRRRCSRTKRKLVAAIYETVQAGRNLARGSPNRHRIRKRKFALRSKSAKVIRRKGDDRSFAECNRS